MHGKPFCVIIFLVIHACTAHREICVYYALYKYFIIIIIIADQLNTCSFINVNVVCYRLFHLQAIDVVLEEMMGHLDEDMAEMDEYEVETDRTLKFEPP